MSLVNHDQGIVTNAEVFDRFEDLTDRPVHFLYRVPDQLPGSAFEFLGDRQRQVEWVWRNSGPALVSQSTFATEALG